MNTSRVRATRNPIPAHFEQLYDAAVYSTQHRDLLALMTPVECTKLIELERLKELYNYGEEFPVRSADFKGGRNLAA